MSRPSRHVRPRPVARVSRRRGLVVALALIPAALAPPASAATAPATGPLVVATSSEDLLSRIGPLRVNTGRRPTSMRAAYTVFGRPSTNRGRRNLRRYRWRGVGLTILGTTYGGCRRRTCRTSELQPQTAKVDGPRWQTSKGLRIGAPASSIAALYPDADTPDGPDDEIPLVEYTFPYGDGDTPTPIVEAIVRDGVVKRFDLFVGSAGE